METVTDPASGVTHYSYDAAGNLVRTEMPNGTIETRHYDDLSRLVFLENTGPGGSTISSYQYTLGPTGLRTVVKEDTGRTVTYTYDGDYRLTGESIVDSTASNRNITYAYDAVGNRLSRTDSVEGTTTYTYDANDRMLTETLGGKSTTETYDNNGNLLSQVSGPSDKTSYTWDFENRLVAADITDASGRNHVAYQYDADGNRVAQTIAGAVTRFLLDTNRPLAQVIEEYTPGSVVQASYVYGLSIILQNRGGVRSFYKVDGLGSIRALTNALGAVTDRYLYDAFGQMLARTGTTTNPYLFTGEQFDPHLGFSYLRARYYDVDTGRFASRDPLLGTLSKPSTLNSYLYALADPINIVDPSGAQGLEEGLVAVGIQSFLVGQLGGGIQQFVAADGTISAADWNLEVLKMQKALDDYDAANPKQSYCDRYLEQAPYFDSVWHIAPNNEKHYWITGGPLGGRTMLGAEVNYYFQGMIAHHYSLTFEAMLTLVFGWKASRYAVIPSDNALLAAGMGWALTFGEEDTDTSYCVLRKGAWNYRGAPRLE
jgi:RHS repeat-associated protein